MILPSKVAEFTKVKILLKVVNETLFINPGKVCKENNPGTFAHLSVYQDDHIKVYL